MAQMSPKAVSVGNIWGREHPRLGMGAIVGQVEG